MRIQSVVHICHLHHRAWSIMVAFHFVFYYLGVVGVERDLREARERLREEKENIEKMREFQLTLSFECSTLLLDKPHVALSLSHSTIDYFDLERWLRSPCRKPRPINHTPSFPTLGSCWPPNGQYIKRFKRESIVDSMGFVNLHPWVSWLWALLSSFIHIAILFSASLVWFSI